MGIRRLGSLLALVWLLGWPAAVAGAPFAYVANFSDDTVSVIDTATDTVTPTTVMGGMAPGAWQCTRTARKCM